VIRNYTDAACATAPTAFTFYQTGVCFVQNATASSLVTATVSTATGVTSFRQTSYGGYKCNGPVSGGQVLGNTTQVCMKTPGSAPLTYYTVTAAPVVALTGGATLAAFATPVDCAATNFGKVATGQLFLPAACGAVLSRNTTTTAMSSCGMSLFSPLFLVFFCLTPPYTPLSGLPPTQVTTLIYASQTVTSAALTLPIAQSPAFKAKFALAVAATLGVPATAVNVTAVAQVSSRRALLAGISVVYKVASPSAAAAAAYTAVLAGSSGAVAGVLSTSYGVVTAAAPVVAVGNPPPTGAPVKSAAARGGAVPSICALALAVVMVATALVQMR